MLKKLLKTEIDDKAIFPIQENSEIQVPQATKDIGLVINSLVANTEFLNMIEQVVTKQILETLLNKYEFEPTDKYKQDIENKKKYISQLDAYLNQRKMINQSVENDLQQFLNNTKMNISKALESFSSGIQTKIIEAENYYGIDKIKQILLSEENKNDD